MWFFRSTFVIVVATAVPAVVTAATVSIEVRGTDGKPLAGAVVMVETENRRAAPIKLDAGYIMAQQNIAFAPHVLIVPTGSTVSFPNRDKVRHHVYSFSKAKKFDLKLYGRDETRSVVFDKPGVVALGCNIHDAMSGFVVVSNTPYAAQSDAGGRVVLNGVPAGGATVRVWHPSIRSADNMLAQNVSVAASGFSTTFTIRGR